MDDKIKGKMNQAVGATREKVADAVGADNMQAKGKAQHAKGDAQEATGDVKDAVNDATDKMTDAAKKSADKMKDATKV